MAKCAHLLADLKAGCCASTIEEQTQDDEEPQVGADGEFNEGQTLEEEKEQMEADAGLEDPVVVERQKEGRRNKEQKKSGEKRKDEAHEKDKEKNQDEDGSMSNSEKLDKLIQMVYDLGKPVEVIQNVLGVKVPDGSSNKQDYENAANFFDDTKGAPNDENEEEANPGDKINAADDGNDEEIIDEEAISATQQLTEATSSSQTFTIPNFDTRVTSPTPTYTSPKFDLLSQESRSSVKCATEVLMRDVGEKSEFQPLMKTKKRSVQQDNQVNDDAEPPVKKKNKGDIGDVALRRSERGQIPSIHTQPPFTGARKKHPIIHPFEPVDKSRKEKMTEWKMSNKNKKHTLIINNVRVNAKWFSDLETPGRKLLKTIRLYHIEAGLELLKTRKRNNPDLFLNKTALVVGVKFLEEIDELYDEFVDDKEEKYWLGILVNLEKRSVTAFNSAAVKFTDANIRAYVNAYAMVLPFMLRNIFKDVNVDTSKFDINVVSEDYPQNQVTMDGSKKMMKRPMQDVYGSDAAEGFNKGKKETTEHYRALLRLSNEHRKSEVAWTVASGTVNSLDDQIELLNAIIESEGKFDLVAELEKLTLEHAEAEDIRGGIKVKIPDWDKLGEKWLLEE
ncbi:hypothetical protein Bca52824_016333 [Brassica carinata]|uniref:Ubiquitin-like protease family profile domain-containing protein n=1 Tax=Brassica carinata TaxID=52824 RepID=A0A8X7W660_BRACI|nr:hypothetical protein Bca52824_016333 [Brassica carinata]